MWTIFLEKEDQQISSIVTERKKLLYTYKNYIYRGKNWEYPVCSVDDGHYGHYHCTLCKGVHPKDWAYKIKPNQQYKCLESNGNSSREGRVLIKLFSSITLTRITDNNRRWRVAVIIIYRFYFNVKLHVLNR